MTAHGAQHALGNDSPHAPTDVVDRKVGFAHDAAVELQTMLDSDDDWDSSAEADESLQGLVRDLVEGFRALDASLYEKCAGCHLFVFDNPAFVPPTKPEDFPVTIARYMHSARGDALDERFEDHEATPSGLRAPLLVWQLYGPSAMRERFVVK
jgi:hypothetical protein